MPRTKGAKDKTTRKKVIRAGIIIGAGISGGLASGLAGKAIAKSVIKKGKSAQTQVLKNLVQTQGKYDALTLVQQARNGADRSLINKLAVMKGSELRQKVKDFRLYNNKLNKKVKRNIINSGVLTGTVIGSGIARRATRPKEESNYSSEAEFGRGKDKAPRKRRAVGIALGTSLGAVGTVGLGVGALALRKKLKVKASLAKKAANTAKVQERRKAINNLLGERYSKLYEGGKDLEAERMLRTTNVKAVKKNSTGRIKNAAKAARKELGSNYKADLDNAEFKRTIGAKDKTKRIKKVAGIGAAVGITGLGLLAAKKYSNPGLKVIKEIESGSPALILGASKKATNAEKVARRKGFIDSIIGERYRKLEMEKVSLDDEAKLRRTAKQASVYQGSAKRIQQASRVAKRKMGADYSDSFYVATFARKAGSKDKTKRQGKILRAGKWWTPNKPTSSNRPGKKYMVLASKKVGDQTKYKLIHYGDSSMKDYTQHRDKTRRKSYRARAKGILLKSGQPAYKDKFQAAYWSMKKW